MKRFMFCLLIVSLPSLLSAQFDEPMRQHDAHVHGEATGNLALDESILRLELDIPAYNLIGFEHAPVNAEQQALLDGTIETLEQLAWIELDPRGQCQGLTVDVHTHGMETAQEESHEHVDHEHSEHDHAAHEHGDHDHGAHEHGDHDHADHGDHDHDQGHDHEHGHGSFHLVAEFDCAAATSLDWIDIDLFSDYSANESLRLDVLTERLVDRVLLGPGRFRVELAR